MTGDGTDAEAATELPDPDVLRERDGVPVVSGERTFETEPFENLQPRYAPTTTPS